MRCGSFANCVPQFLCLYIHTVARRRTSTAPHTPHLSSSLRLHYPTSKKDVLRRSLFWPEILVSGSFSECLWFVHCQSRAFLFEFLPRGRQQGQRRAEERWGGEGSLAYRTEVIGLGPLRVLRLTPHMARSSFKPWPSAGRHPFE